MGEQIPEDLGIKVNTRAGKFWDNQLKEVEENIVQAEGNLQIMRNIRELSIERIAEEKEKLK